MIPFIFKKHKSTSILIGDAIMFAVALTFMLLLRYGFSGFTEAFTSHRAPFGILLGIWIIVFYICDLYSYPKWNASLENIRIFLTANFANLAISIGMFYVFGEFFKLTPKLNLSIFTITFVILDGLFRWIVARLLSAKGHATAVVIFSQSPLAETLQAHIRKHPQLGYTVSIFHTAEDASASLESQDRTIVVLDKAFLRDESILRTIATARSTRTQIETLTEFFERIMHRVPLEELEEEWIIKEIRSSGGAYAFAKRTLDILLSLCFLVFFSPLIVIFGIAIASSSKGPIIYLQRRVGKDGVVFTLRKFRTMRVDAEKNGAQWSQAHDPRATRIGAFLRRTHLDEIPQLWNILCGDMSFVGPRPERPEFTAQLDKEIVHYHLRERILPGLTGWAQIKFRYASTVIDSKEKFEYDLYYLKNKNLLIDIGVLVKTVQFVFISAKNG